MKETRDFLAQIDEATGDHYALRARIAMDNLLPDCSDDTSGFPLDIQLEYHESQRCAASGCMECHDRHNFDEEDPLGIGVLLDDEVRDRPNNLDALAYQLAFFGGDQVPGLKENYGQDPVSWDVFSQRQLRLMSQDSQRTLDRLYKKHQEAILGW